MKDVNAHLHTPWSFSAFRDIPQALDQAAAENVKVVGINDFYTVDGYAEWDAECRKRDLYPLFNIEMIALSAEDRDAGLRVNDPKNPGRTYLSGKGLAFPVTLRGEEARMLASVKAESEKQVALMCERLNRHLEGVKAGFTINFERMARELACGQVRERHLAKALRLAVEWHGIDKDGRLELYSTIFGSEPKSSIDDAAAMENEIRSRLLKAGGAAFVPESPEAFLPLDTVCRIIRAAGGIPTYPFLGDDAKGGFTDFEADLEKAADTLRRRGIPAVEFITTRNTTAVLESYAGWLEDEGFIVSFGSEHNTPAMEPIRLRTRDHGSLSEKLRGINWRGACAIAAHQAGLSIWEEGEKLINETIDTQ